MSQEYDRSSKWLIEHFGPSILRLAGVTDIVSCRALPGEVVQPRQLPDGVLEARLASQPKPVLYTVEIESYSNRQVCDQVLRDALLILLDRQVLPEAITLILRPKGNYQVPGEEIRVSSQGTTRLQFNWRVVELWKLTAAELLACNDVGLIPWVPLTQIDGPPEVIFQECRRRIDEQAPEALRANLRAVTQVLAGLCYDDERLLAILGGERAMIESPVLQRLLDKKMREAAVTARQEAIVQFLEDRFGPVAPEIRNAVAAVSDETRLRELNRLAALASDLAAFRAGIGVAG